MTQINIQWRDPPDRKPNRYKQRSDYLKAFASILKKEPSRWVILERPSWLSSTQAALQASARNIRKGRWPGGEGFETRVVGDKIFIRYMGE